MATLLFQIASPAHIPWGDTRWQEILHGYDVWVHMEHSTEDAHSFTIMNQACESMSKHAAVSSNLAALSLHVTRMLRELVRDLQKSKSDTEKTADFSRRISRVAKARATAGALQLLRLLCHPVVVKCSGSSKQSNCSSLEEAFIYHTRGDLPCDQPAMFPLVNSIMDLLAVSGGENDAIETPEVYDAIVLSFHLLFVLCGTQLYRPFESSFQQKEDTIHYVLEELFREGEEKQNEPINNKNFRLFYASSRSTFSQTSFRDSSTMQHTWTPQAVIETCIQWQIQRPKAPEGSISHFYFIAAQAAVSAKGGETKGPDGMYESHMVVQAAAPTILAGGLQLDDPKTSSVGDSIHTRALFGHESGKHNIILDATKGVLVLSSSIIMLPFRLMSLVIGVLASKRGGKDGKASIAAQKFKTPTSSRTRDVLWLSDSILADLGSCLILLLVNNYRGRKNHFRTQLSALVDNRWETDNDTSLALPDLPLNGEFHDFSSSSLVVEDLVEAPEKEAVPPASKVEGESLTLNFESLFESFGRTLHTETGALMLYTLLQSSLSFSESLAVRSDLDTLVLPLLRTLYFSSRTNTYVSKDFASSRPSIDKQSDSLDIRSCPFRSLSQLYVIVILLLLFSQDTSFGRDAFRRSTVSNVLWYKERHLRNINLGSIIVLTLLRSLMFNLHRLRDAFLLSNCCAVLMNLSSSIVDLHEYASMRLVSVTVSVMKRHVKLLAAQKEIQQSENGKAKNDEEGDESLSTPLGMCSEVARTLLGTIKDCLSPRNLERNLHLVYALVYYQTDLLRIFKEKQMYSSKQYDRIESIISAASSLIQGEGARSAPKALKVLEDEIAILLKAVEKKKKKEHLDDFTFTYEEEADPEVFFVPYVWETIACVVTSSTIEWKKEEIRAFSLLEPLEEPIVAEHEQISTVISGDFHKDAEDLV